ncbi:MAG: cytochrome c oxidase assembly protein [Acidimicrobiales bacterium]|nr:cytochrome c oxidase assembly protein [Acidimicrobiales bacterium]
MLAQADPLRWQAHPEVWLLVACVVGLGLYATRVIGPKVVEPGEPVATFRQKAFFTAGVLVLWLGSDWPMHDLAEQYLYSMHMVQHFLLTYVMPPLFLLAIPTWLARLVVPPGSGLYPWLRRLAHPVVAAIVFNALTIATHWTVVVNTSVEVGPFHYVVHTVIVASAFLVWTPVCGPWPELRISVPAQMVYLFLLSVIPTVPGAWLTLAERAVYSVYDTSERIWGVTVTEDQQYAGLFMKVGGGMYLWGIIVVLFFRWALGQERTTSPARIVRLEDGIGAGEDPAPAPAADAQSQRNVEAAATGAATAQATRTSQA